MKDAQDVDISIIFQEVADSIMAVQKDANIPLRGEVVMADLRERCEYLHPLPNPLNCLSRGPRVIRGDVFEDVPEQR